MAKELCFKGQDPVSCSPKPPKKEKFKVAPKTKTPPPPVIPSGGLHMNMNNLGGNPGDVQMQKKSSSSEISSRQEEQGRANETFISKQKANIAKRKQMMEALKAKKKTTY